MSQVKKFNTARISKILLEENIFITNLLSNVPLYESEDSSSEEEDAAEQTMERKSSQIQKTRAKSFTELQERLTKLQSKKKLNVKGKLAKKELKGKFRKATKQNVRNIKHKLMHLQKSGGIEVKHELKLELKPNARAAKPIFNEEGKIVFSKFDFSGLGQKPEKKPESDPKKVLKNLEKQKAKLDKMESQGDVEKATELKLKQAWKNVVAKAEGKKVKDDPTLLKKSIKKRDQKKKSSEAKWKARTEGVQKQKESKQAKRTDNLLKRKKQKKVKKMKHAAKRGRVVPGF